MGIIPRQLGDEHFPGMGEEYEVGLANVGITVVDTTIVKDNATSRTDAQVLSSPANTNSNVNAVGPIVHSLGAAPSVAFIQPLTGSNGFDSAIFVTADNSAVYFRARAWTNPALGFATRMIAIR